MKRFIGFISILALVMFISQPTYSQTNPNDNRIVVDKSDLTPSQLIKLEADAKIAELEKKVSTYGKWVGVGGEIGTAIKEGLTAVVDVADKFGGTKVGTFTMTMIAWKVMGKDIVRMSIGVILILIIISFGIRSYVKTCLPRRVLVESEGFFGKKKYEYKDPIYGTRQSDLGNAQTFHVVLIILSLASVCLMMFV